MQLRKLFICVLAGFIGLIPVSIFAQGPIQVITTFDYPGTGNSTTPFGINGNGDIAGRYESGGVTRGFVRFRNGTFSSPLVAPNDTGGFTAGFGINNARRVGGESLTAATGTTPNTFHGFFWNNGVFTQFDFGGLVSTAVTGINDAGNFTGAFGSFAQPNKGFINIGGTSTAIIVPGACDSFAYGINNSNRVVGEYRVSCSPTSTATHGFIRSSNGTITNSVDFPGSTSTSLFGISNSGWIVGSYNDALGKTHGFLRKNANTYISFDFPGATVTGTSLNGINNSGLISGRYTDSAGIRHGFIAQFRNGHGDDDDGDDDDNDGGHGEHGDH